MDECLPAATRELGGGDIPERVGIRAAEGAVVGEDLEIVEAVPAGRVERGEDGRDVGVAVASGTDVAALTERMAARFERDIGRAELTSLPLTIVILLVAFGELALVRPWGLRLPRRLVIVPALTGSAYAAAHALTAYVTKPPDALGVLALQFHGWATRDPTGQSTWCHACGSLLIGRDWYRLETWSLTDDGRCDACGPAIPGAGTCSGTPRPPQPGGFAGRPFPPKARISGGVLDSFP